MELIAHFILIAEYHYSNLYHQSFVNQLHYKTGYSIHQLPYPAVATCVQQGAAEFLAAYYNLQALSLAGNSNSNKL